MYALFWTTITHRIYMPMISSSGKMLLSSATIGKGRKVNIFISEVLCWTNNFKCHSIGYTSVIIKHLNTLFSNQIMPSTVIPIV